MSSKLNISAAAVDSVRKSVAPNATEFMSGTGGNNSGQISNSNSIYSSSTSNTLLHNAQKKQNRNIDNALSVIPSMPAEQNSLLSGNVSGFYSQTNFSNLSTSQISKISENSENSENDPNTFNFPMYERQNQGITENIFKKDTTKNMTTNCGTSQYPLPGTGCSTKKGGKFGTTMGSKNLISDEEFLETIALTRNKMKMQAKLSKMKGENIVPRTKSGVLIQ